MLSCSFLIQNQHTTANYLALRLPFRYENCQISPTPESICWISHRFGTVWTLQNGPLQLEHVRPKHPLTLCPSSYNTASTPAPSYPI